MISNLRWLLLVSVTLVSFADAFISHGGDIDLGYLLPLILLLVIAALYNIGVTLLLSYGTLRRAIPVMTLLIDTILTIGFVNTSGGLTSPLLFFALFPILTAALRFHWLVSFLVALVIVLVSGVFTLVTESSETPFLTLLPSMAHVIVLLLATLISGLVGDRVKKTIAHQRRLEEEAELRKLRTTKEHSRAIFELASTLSATLNYSKVLEGVLEVGEAGIRELGQSSSTHASLVMLFGQNDLHIVTSRHLTYRDRGTTFKGKKGIIGQALTTAEAVVTDDPGADAELGQQGPARQHGRRRRQPRRPAQEPRRPGTPAEVRRPRPRADRQRHARLRRPPGRRGLPLRRADGGEPPRQVRGRQGCGRFRPCDEALAEHPPVA